MNTLILPWKNAVETDQILYLESDSNYTVIYKTTSPKKIVASQSLCHVQQSLSPSNFIRINRQHVINIAQVSKYWLEGRSKVCIELHDGTLFHTSRRRTSTFLNTIAPF